MSEGGREARNRDNYESVYSGLRPELGSLAAETQKRLLALIPGGLKGKRVLEFGFGNGEVLAFLSKIGADAYGVEFAEASAASAKNKAEIMGLKRPPTVKIGDFASRLPFQDGFFDAVASFHAIEHLSDDRPVMAEFRRVLKDGGVLAIGVPRVEEGHETDRQRITNPLHFREYSRTSLKRLLSDSGFELEEMISYDRALNRAAKELVHGFAPKVAKALLPRRRARTGQAGAAAGKRDSPLARLHRATIRALSGLNLLDGIFPGEGESLFCIARLGK